MAKAKILIHNPEKFPPPLLSVPSLSSFTGSDHFLLVSQSLLHCYLSQPQKLYSEQKLSAFMATHFSPATPVRFVLQPKQNPPKTLLSIRDSFGGGSACKKCQPRTVNVCSWSSSANYVRSQDGAARLSGNASVVKKQLFQKRAGIVRAATIEEIEAEKSLIKKDAEGRMERTLETVRSNFNSIRTGRASPAMLDKIEVEYYGSPVGLKTIANISSPDASSFLVQPYDKSSLKAIEKAIVSSDLGLTPNNDGEVIRLTLPQLTSERRKELSKIVAKQTEEGKVALRNIRRDALKTLEKLEKAKKLSEDNVKDLSSDLQKLTDEYVKKLDAIFKQKEKELLKV
ncbi:ribosome-recycling factor [Pyrus ussuriensis x Pyrus communis]|uniref:Ribosome-recycling factor, chloroplastic n=1 Tax=Pyrus ussuriensis x Pyrus communis TaxID=2448454 RepID=A0A5N5FQN7_9ROSA|nr:ribosome-recycling factor [Pyrus ussuriensis x Pyrus communis]